jgi:hypothetical protein
MEVANICRSSICITCCFVSTMITHQGGPKMANFGVHNFLFSKIWMQNFDVLEMQINPFEGRRQEEYLSLKLISFQIMTCAPIWSIKGKVGSKNMDFLKFIIGRCYVG